MNTSLSQPLNFSRYRHRVVRDLAWSCFSAPLMAQLPGSDATVLSPTAGQWERAWLASLDQDPTPLSEALEQHQTRRLGLYFEQLIAFYLRAHPRWDLLGHNLQVSEAGRTRGAFDFLCRYDNQYWHLELAVKFYLGSATAEDPTAWHEWWGPNANDRLDIKLDRLAQHQLPLSQSGTGRAYLADWLGESVPWQQGLIIKGYYFYPGEAAPCPPRACHSDHLHGRWWPISRFSPDPTRCWYPLTRDQWLAPAYAREYESPPLPPHELRRFLREQVEDKKQAQLLAAMERGPGGWHETDRVFIVPDQWPGDALPSRKM